MKKITFALILLSIGAQAQDFPSPYCNLPDTDIEEITSIIFAGTTITNTDSSAILINKTTTSIDVMQSEIYTISVEGNTYGSFDTKIVAYIDWNQNGILDDAGEVFEVGVISDSSGDDDVSVSVDIAVPANALVGTTRARITKIYTDPDAVAVNDPCAISFDIIGIGIYPSFGQAIDFTINTSILGINEFDSSALSIYPVPARDILNIKYKSLINVVKIYNLLGQEVLVENKVASHVQINVSSLTAGIYVVKLFSDEGEHSFRAIKD